jgi:Fic family protein
LEEAIKLINRYKSLELSNVVDYTKFNLYAITHHSTIIEGSTLTEIETRLLLDEGLTPKGKPLTHSLMTKNHFEALQFVIEQASKKVKVNEILIKNINAHVLKNTGAVYNTLLGTVDSSKGEYRLGNVRAGNQYFVNYAKVSQLTKELCKTIQDKLQSDLTIEEQIHLSFDAHFNLVSIHPFYDGNGRTSRILMNFIQSYFNLPLAIVQKEDKSDYFEALEETRKEETLTPFRHFMTQQYSKYLKTEIDNYTTSTNKSSNKGGFTLMF